VSDVPRAFGMGNPMADRPRTTTAGTPGRSLGESAAPCREGDGHISRRRGGANGGVR
jgi:hypothetical protein